MSDAEADGYDVDLEPLGQLVGDPLFELIIAGAPEAVTWRIAKAADHYNKARKLMGVDDEMGVIRLIAAEEELVVGIFRCLERTPDAFPGADIFLRHYKKHHVKLAFYPTLRQFEFAAAHLMQGFSLPGLEDRLVWKGKLEVEGGKVVVRISNQDGKTLMDVDPLQFSISRDDLDDDAVVPSLLEQMKVIVREQRGIDLKTFIEERAVYRDRLLYAYDETPPIFAMGETLEELFATFDETLERLLFVLAILLNGPPPVKSWGVVAQFIELYRRVLAEYGHGKPPMPAAAAVPDTHVQVNFAAISPGQLGAAPR